MPKKLAKIPAWMGGIPKAYSGEELTKLYTRVEGAWPVVERISSSLVWSLMGYHASVDGLTPMHI